MNRALRGIKEWINPSWARHRSIPPFEAGLRPNRLLDESSVLLPPDPTIEPDDVAFLPSGDLVFSSGTRVFVLKDEGALPIATLPGRAGALGVWASEVFVAVDGLGIVALGGEGDSRVVSDDPLLSRCVTDLAVQGDSTLLATVGSATGQSWAQELTAGERSGRVVSLVEGVAQIEADQLAWPSGIAVSDAGEVLLSLSFEHRVERRLRDRLGSPGRVMAGNLPVYPGRIRRADNGWWVAAPYARNRMTELIFDEPDLLEDMVATIEPDQWLVPRLRSDNPYNDTLQMGQMRVLGIIKPWAPPRSYGLVFRLDEQGRIAEGAHSRADQDRHGVTGVAWHRDRLVVAAQGFRNLLDVPHGGSQS